MTRNEAYRAVRHYHFQDAMRCGNACDPRKAYKLAQYLAATYVFKVSTQNLNTVSVILR